MSERPHWLVPQYVHRFTVRIESSAAIIGHEKCMGPKISIKQCNNATQTPFSVTTPFFLGRPPTKRQERRYCIYHSICTVFQYH